MKLILIFVLISSIFFMIFLASFMDWNSLIYDLTQLSYDNPKADSAGAALLSFLFIGFITIGGSVYCLINKRK